MKRLLLVMLAVVSVFVLSACGEEDKVLTIVFVPSRDAAEVLEVTKPLESLLKTELAKLGFDFDEVNIEVSADYAIAAQALDAGTADVAFLPGGTYVVYQDGVVPILAATRNSLTKDFDNAMDWNDGLATLEVEGSNNAVSYRSLLVAGPSAKGREIAAIINAGEDLVWDDIKDANFCVQGATSSAGYIYPNIWFQDMFGKTLTDLGTNAVSVDGYGTSMANLASGTCDISSIYGDARMHNATKWTTTFERTLTIWDETDVIGVTDAITNDGIQVGQHVSIKLAEALQIAFINLVNDSGNKDIFDVYSHSGYMPVTSIGYDGARKASEIDPVLD